MKLNYITFMARDIEKTIEFYTKIAELKIVRRFNPGAGEIVFLANSEDETSLEFIQFENMPAAQTKGMTISFKAYKSLDELREIVISLGYNPSEIINESPKPEHFKVLDPNNIEVEFSL